MKKIGLLLILLSTISLSQPWNYDFGSATGSYSTASGVSLTFLPDPQTGGGADARVRIGTTGGSFNLEDQTISFGTQSYLRVVAPTSTSVNKFSIYDYTAGKSFTIRFRVRLGASDGTATGAASGTWYLFIGDGACFSDNNGFTGAQVFTGLRWVFGASGAITTNYRSGTSWVTTGISGTPFSQGTTYIVDIYGNNSTSSSSYTYGSSQSVASNKFDLWINGTLVGDDLGKAALTADVNIDSYMFYGESSTANVANIFLDDIQYTNTIVSTPFPVELSSFTLSARGKVVNLQWITQTEVSNYGFEIERALSVTSQIPCWEKLGFVAGAGNSNSPKYYSFTDNKTPGCGKYNYRLKQIDADGKFEYSPVIEADLGAVKEYVLNQNYPNPFNPSTVIRYAIPQTGNVKLSIYNILGSEVATLVNEFQEAGVYTKEFSVNRNGLQLSNGVYFYKLESGNFTDTKKFILMK